jgi:hypothetical protein
MHLPRAPARFLNLNVDPPGVLRQQLVHLVGYLRENVLRDQVTELDITFPAELLRLLAEIRPLGIFLEVAVEGFFIECAHGIHRFLFGPQTGRCGGQYI